MHYSNKGQNYIIIWIHEEKAFENKNAKTFMINTCNKIRMKGTSSVTRTQHFHCQGRSSIPGKGHRLHYLCSASKGKKKKKNKYTEKIICGSPGTQILKMWIPSESSELVNLTGNEYGFPSLWITQEIMCESGNKKVEKI